MHACICNKHHDVHAGSGKTHTLIGDISSGQEKGLLARAVNEIAVGVAECSDDCYFQVCLSLMLAMSIPPRHFLGKVHAELHCHQNSLLQQLQRDAQERAPFPDEHPGPPNQCACPEELCMRCMQVNLSVVEIYCERIRDLLSDEAGSDNLVVQQDRQRGVYIAGAIQVTLCNALHQILTRVWVPYSSNIRFP